jgi:hypothetical protein
VSKNSTYADRPMYDYTGKTMKPRSIVGSACDCSQEIYRRIAGKQTRCVLKLDAALAVSALDPPVQYLTACSRLP